MGGRGAKPDRLHALTLVFCALWLLLAPNVWANTPPALRSGSAFLGWQPHPDRGITLSSGAGDSFSQRMPIAIGVVDTSGVQTWFHAPYNQQGYLKFDGKQCVGYVFAGDVRTKAGTVFHVRDAYAPLPGAEAFTLTRTVTVASPQAADVAFNSEFSLPPTELSAMRDNDFFAPGIWYGDNAHVPSHALAANPDDHAFLFREDRLPLPLIVTRNRKSGATCLIAHLGGSPTTLAGENGSERITDARLQFGSLGIERTDRPSPTFLFPGSEGERTYIRGARDHVGWAYRSHPVAAGVSHTYRLLLRVSRTTSFPDAVRDSWRVVYEGEHPQVIRADLGKVYRDSMNLLDTLCRPYQGVTGIPFAATVPQGEVVDSSSQMGFVGQALPAAALLLRYGFETKNADTLARASAVVDYWAANSLSPAGVPRTWYDVHPDGPVTWRNYHTFLRVASDGFDGALQAWNAARAHGIDHPGWLAFCRAYGDFLVRVQNPDGSFAREYDFEGHAVNSVTDTTDQAVPYLVDLFQATGDTRYRRAAMRAGTFCLSTVHNAYAYVGGTPDNPNVMDKEGGIMALAAFLALHDICEPMDPLRQRYLAAAVQAATFSETWVYSWNIPIPKDETGAIYPPNRTTLGLSLIATGHSGADNYMASAPFFFYRLYVLTGDAHFRTAARMLLYDTKQMLDWDGTLHYAQPGLLTEALSLAPRRGHGVTHYLPWLTVAILTPMTQLRDVYGDLNIDRVDSVSQAELRKRDGAYSTTHGFAPPPGQNAP